MDNITAITDTIAVKAGTNLYSTADHRSAAEGRALYSEFCHLCGRKIQGSGTAPAQAKAFHHKKWPRDLSLLVCEKCLKEKPRCRRCGLPMSEESPNGACTTCNQTLPLCLSCGQEIKGQYYDFDPRLGSAYAGTGPHIASASGYAGGPYCKTCVKGKRRKPCDVCGAPLTDQHWQLSDGRLVCAYCHATVVYAPADATALYEEMKATVGERLGMSLNVPTGLALVDRNQLRDVIHKQLQSVGSGGTNTGRVAAGAISTEMIDAQELDPERTLGIYARRGMRRGIYIQTGLPRMLFLQVAAHEYAHAWQGENCPVLSDPLVHEGYAEWIAYHVMGYYGYPQGQERMLARQDIYGRGLRWALDIEASQSVSGVILACRRSM